MKKIFFLISTIGILLFACKTTKTATKPKTTPSMAKLEWSILKAGNMGTTESVRNVLAKSDAEWKKEWAENTKRFEPAPPAPEVDFSKYWIIGYHLGTHSNGGYNVTVKDIQNASGEIVISVVENAPGKGCMNSEVITHPFVYVKIVHFTESKVSYKMEKVVKDCNTD